MEFLTIVEVNVPAGTDHEDIQERLQAEAKRAAELAADGQLLRIWRAADKDTQALALWQADDATHLEKVLLTLPMHDWFSIEVTPLAHHPSDPGI